jgi:oligogalacturonide transporter
MVPYNGLLPDMVEDYTVRSKFSSIRMIFSSFGAILAGLIPTIMIKDNTNSMQYFSVALIFGVIFIISILITFFGTWERDKPVKPMTMGETFTQSFTVYKSRAFVMFLCIFIFGQCAADFVTGLAVYYIDDVLNAYGGGNFTLLMGILLIAQFLGMIIFAPIMAKTSKKFPVLIATPVRIVATLALLFFSYEGANFKIILALSFVIGLGMAATSTSIYAILSDMADVDELITGISRPGTVSGMATFIRKISTGLSTFLIGLLLSAINYDELLAAQKMRQCASVQMGIVYIYVFSQIILLLITLFVTWKFPMGKKEFEIIVREVQRRKGEEHSTITEDEKRICEKVTGFKYENLWDKNNALRFKNN